MAKRAKKNSKEEQEEKEPLLKNETWSAIWGIVFLAAALFFFLASFEIAGPAGRAIFGALFFLFGYGYYLVPILFIILALAYFKAQKPKLALMSIIGGAIFIVSGLGLAELVYSRLVENSERTAGGIVGWLTASGLGKLFGFYITLIFLLALFIISLLIVSEAKFSLKDSWKLTRSRPEGETDKEATEPAGPKEIAAGSPETPQKPPEPAPPSPPEEAVVRESKKETGLGKFFEGLKRRPAGIESLKRLSRKPYSPPPLELLSQESGRPSAGDIKANANIIKRTLANFGISVEMDEITIGPSVTRYALKPAEGVKLSRIVALSDNLALALAAHPIRIEAPIPSKSLVGIEIPNSVRTTVRLGSILASPIFAQSTAPLLIALGRDTAGIAHFADLSRMPHLLISGSTGSGKSVAIHSLITSLVYRNPPDNLRFIMIDPKRVELTLYNRIPHLLTEVVTDAKKAILALKWAAKEMERRYDILEAETVRNIASYHENVLEPPLKSFKEMLTRKKLTEEERTAAEAGLPETMPYLLIIIDELADMMSTYPREFEAAVVRLAQMSRAVGIHLVLSTQRPSTEVITGLIKANIPSRIAMQVPSQIDSRTIIDMSGAEKLLGAGDMLYLSGEMSKPIRLQSAFVSESEVKQVAGFLTKEYQAPAAGVVELSAELETSGQAGSLFDEPPADDDDELYEEARQVVIQYRRASTSLLQRKLKIGYARAARLMDMLEERGVVGAGEGAKPREVYLADAAPENEK